jgi:hypothetical protein
MGHKVSPLKYLITMLNDKNDFLYEYKKLNNEEQEKMKQWGEEEMNHKFKKGKENE